MDLNHFIGNDLQISATGDVGTVTDDDETQQRIIRRLLTNQGTYIWHLDYGAGLGRYIGAPENDALVRGSILSQMRLEDAVSPSPVPVVTLNPIQNGLFCNLKYWESQNPKPKTLSFNVNI